MLRRKPCTGIVPGFYADSTLAVHGFLRGKSGNYTRIDPPSSIFTHVTQIDQSDNVLGFYLDSASHHHAFSMTSNGTFTTIDAPRSSFSDPVGYINDSEVVGMAIVGADARTRSLYGGVDFLRTSTGSYGSILVKGAASTHISSVSETGYIAGTYVNADGSSHAFLTHLGKSAVFCGPVSASSNDSCK